MKCSSRKFVDLVFKASSKWANWDPPYPIECGHFGIINPETGQLEIYGNIYDESFKKDLRPDLARMLSENPPIKGEVENDFIITTAGVSIKGLDVSPEVGIAGVLNISLALQLQFPENKRAASLTMHKPRQTFIPPNTLLEPLFKVEQLKGKCLVTRTLCCPAYSLFLSNKSGEELSLALVADSPLTVAPGVTAGGKVSTTWKTNIQAEYHRNASSKTGNYSFTPLFDLRRKASSWNRILRDSPAPEPAGDDLWTDVQLPWSSLDEDGEEVFHDEVCASIRSHDID
ncbi:hypothetical protein BJ138DRAFT_1014043 [Hygrophoropsis aurantiaca]|uniref:Uncharacterized protein n=1 Tax=Hygrophoropsis aurantiaca TaxID=72124 RepID=A0ACB8A3V0_9AGAM|nr:hypothetical protein BJ138DRAFT_1014043 [Hygrophoropsis aurantiaca]